MVSLSKRRKEARLQSYDGRTLTARKYNATIFGMILYGLVANFLICLFCSNMAATVNSVAFFLAYLVCVIVGCIMSAVSTNPVAGFVGYNLIVLPSGFVISVAVQEYGGLGSEVVTEAFLAATLIIATMTFFAVLNPQFCNRLGSLLFMALMGLIAAEVMMLFMGMKSSAISWASAIIFSFYISYDVSRSQVYPYTISNAVGSAMDIYLDIVNLFLSLLEIFGQRSDD